VAISAPKIPELPIQNQPASPMRTFGATTVVTINDNKSNYTMSSQKQSIDNSIKTGFNINEDPYQHVGSMANRGRYSYASSIVSTVNGPRRLRKRKEPVPFK